MDNKVNYIKFNEKTGWILCQSLERYFFMKLNDKGGTPLTTPGKKLVTTLYKELAERIFDDLEAFGSENMSVKSILPWHFTMVDNFASKTSEEIGESLAESFLKEADWTFKDGSSIESWDNTFGEYEERKSEIVSFMKGLTNMQLTAMCCIANAHESLNLSYVLAKIMENFEGRERFEKFSRLALMMSNGIEKTANDYMADFETFDLYYGIHMNEAKAPEEKAVFFGKTSPEDLAGRNYFHYTKGLIDEKQPDSFDTGSLGIAFADVKRGKSERNGSFSEFLPEDCWVKVLFSGDDIYHYIVLEADENYNVKNVFALQETAETLRSSFEKPEEMPLVANKELENLFKGRAVKQNFHFMGSKLPFEFREEYRIGETTFSYAAGSAFRKTFAQLEIEADEEGRVKKLTCTSYKDFGDGLDAMFSSPEPCENREDELMDLMVDIVDLYSDEEFEEEVKNNRV